MGRFIKVKEYGMKAFICIMAVALSTFMVYAIVSILIDVI